MDHKLQDFELLTRLNGDYPEIIWESLLQIGVDPKSTHTKIKQRFCTAHNSHGIPTEFTSQLTDKKVQITVSPTDNLIKAYRVASTFDVSIQPLVEGSIQTASDLMRNLVHNFELRRRDLCLAAGSFLGSDRYAWHDLKIGKMNIPTFHTIREKVFADWKLVGQGDPRNGQLTYDRLKDLDGVESSVCINARFYYRKNEQRLILDLHGSGDIHIAAPDLDNEEINQFVNAIDAQLRSSFGCISRAVTAKGESVVLDHPVAWEDLFLDNATRKLLQTEVTNFFQNRELFKQMKIPHRRGLLLYGVPGTGKTMFGKVLVSTIENCLFLWITASDVDDADSIAAIFSVARAADRAVLFFEDLDMYASHRSHFHNTSTLGELMVQMDGMHSNEGILIIGTTNDLEAIEPALKDRPSRFDRVIEFCPPPESVRTEFLTSLLSEFGVDDQLIQNLAASTEGFTGAQIKELAIVAKSTAAQRGSTVIEEDDLQEAIRQARRFKAVPTGFAGGQLHNPNDQEDY